MGNDSRYYSGGPDYLCHLLKINISHANSVIVIMSIYFMQCSHSRLRIIYGLGLNTLNLIVTCWAPHIYLRA